MLFRFLIWVPSPSVSVVTTAFVYFVSISHLESAQRGKWDTRCVVCRVCPQGHSFGPNTDWLIILSLLFLFPQQLLLKMARQ